MGTKKIKNRLVSKKFISKKKNGHKDDCKCPICINMKFAKKGGYGLKDYDDYEKELKEVEPMNNADNIETDKIDKDNITIAKDEEYDIFGGKRQKKKKSQKKRKIHSKKKRSVRKKY